MQLSSLTRFVLSGRHKTSSSPVFGIISSAIMKNIIQLLWG